MPEMSKKVNDNDPGKKRIRVNATLRKVLIFPFVVLIRFYQVCISPYKPPTCRFTPTCSEYALQAFRKWGPFKGLYLTVRRLLRCHPWGGSGYDPNEDMTVEGNILKFEFVLITILMDECSLKFAFSPRMETLDFDLLCKIHVVK